MEPMGILSWIVFGFLAGAIAKFFMPGRDPGGCVVTILLGIVGAFIGGAIGTSLGWGKIDGFDLRSLGLAILGSLVILILYRVVMTRR